MVMITIKLYMVKVVSYLYYFTYCNDIKLKVLKTIMIMITVKLCNIVKIMVILIMQL